MTKRRWYWLVGFVIALTLFVVITWTFFGRPLTYEISANYHGWVIIQYGDSECPVLRMEGIRLVIPVSSSGCTCTSTLALEGFRHRRFEVIQTDGTKQQVLRRPEDNTGIWGESGYGSGPNRPGYRQFLRETFFVGTNSEFQKQAKFHPITKYPETKICTDLDEHGRAQLGE